MKKRVLSLLLTVVMICTLLPVSAFAATTASGTSGNITWVLDSSGTLTISGTGAMKNYSQARYSTGWATSAPWGQYYSSIKTVVVESGVTSIGSNAFIYCDSLTNIAIADSVTSIGDHALYDCESLTGIDVAENNDNFDSIDGVLFNKDKTKLIQYPIGKTDAEYIIPDSIKSIGEYAFANCSSLESITIPDSVTGIGKEAFAYCRGLTSIIIPAGVASIGHRAFTYCSSLTNITIPDSVTGIGDGAFWGCSKLTSIVIPDNVTSIENDTFTFCSKLTSITIPDSVTNIGDGAFCGCSSLASITIPGSVKNIGSGAFEDCSSLTSVTIPNSVTSIKEATFRCCSSLKSIAIPNSVTSIVEAAFDCCDCLEAVCYCGTEDQWNAITIGEYNECLTSAAIRYHDYTAIVTEPTCTQQGYTTHTCSICGDSYVDSYVDAHGHNYVNGVCTYCGDKQITPTLSILAPSATKVKYGDTLILHAYVEDMPDGCCIEWSYIAIGAKVTPSTDGATCAVKCTGNGAVIVTAKLYYSDGTPVTDDDGALSASRILIMDGSCRNKFVSFWKDMFGINRII